MYEFNLANIANYAGIGKPSGPWFMVEWGTMTGSWDQTVASEYAKGRWFMLHGNSREDEDRVFQRP